LAEALDKFGVTEAVEKHVNIRGRRKFGSAANTKAVVLMMAAGGDCLDDLSVLRTDTALQQLLNMEIAAPETVRQWLYEFHDSALVERAEREAIASGAKAFVPEESGPLKGLIEANRALLAAAQKRNPQREATIDIDATIEESHKVEAKAHYLDGRGYQPVTAVWAEQDVIVLDEFRDGNVPAHQNALEVIQRAFSLLPEGIERRLFRSDTQSYSPRVIEWLLKEKIEFAIGAQKREGFNEACEKAPSTAWKCVEQRDDTQVDVAELEYLPKWVEHLRGQFRFLAVRMTPRQQELLESGTRRVVYLALATNRKGAPVDVLRWYWAKAGTIEKCHDVLKNELGAGVLPCGRFGANAAWLRLSVLTYNLLSILKRIGPNELRDARPKRLRLHLLAFPAAVVRHARRLFASACERLVAARHAVTVRYLVNA
jgi:hypothetical protein